MAWLNQEQKDQVAQAIARAERRTSSELVVVLAGECDDYLYIPTLWAALLALGLPGLLGFIAQPLAYPGLTQVVVFVLVGLLFQWSPLKFRLLPASVKQRRASLVAREQFLANGLGDTRDRNTILIFIARGERYVELLADRGINERVPAGTWDAVVGKLTGSLRAGTTPQGLIEAIDRCGDLLAEHFPYAEGDVDELPNHLIELPAARNSLF